MSDPEYMKSNQISLGLSSNSTDWVASIIDFGPKSLDMPLSSPSFSSGNVDFGHMDVD